jgi:glycine cleavage system regulatory protein
MQRALVMTVIGRDRPGLVESVAGLVTEHGGNWLESRMSRLGGQFAGILRVEVPPENEQRLVIALNALDRKGLSIVVQPDQPAGPARREKLQVLDIIGQDRPGIIRQISRVLAEQGINVEELETECASAAMSGESIFKAHAKLSMPESCDAAKVRAQLEKIAEDLIVEISLAEFRPDAP